MKSRTKMNVRGNEGISTENVLMLRISMCKKEQGVRLVEKKSTTVSVSLRCGVVTDAAFVWKIRVQSRINAVEPGEINEFVVSCCVFFKIIKFCGYSNLTNH